MASFLERSAGPAGQPRRAASGGHGEDTRVLRLPPEPEEGAIPAPGAELEVDLGRGEQREGQERVQAEVHAQPLLISCWESRLVVHVLRTGQPQSGRGTVG